MSLSVVKNVVEGKSNKIGSLSDINGTIVALYQFSEDGGFSGVGVIGVGDGKMINPDFAARNDTNGIVATVPVTGGSVSWVPSKYRSD